MFSKVLAATLCFASVYSKVLVSMPVTIDGIQRDLNLMQGETAQMAATSFAETYGLDKSEQFAQVVNQLSTMLTKEIEKSDTAERLLHIPLTLDNQQVHLDMYDGQTINEALDNFFSTYTINPTTQQELRPQLETVLHQHVNEFLAQQAQNQNPNYAFTMPLTLGSEKFEIHHYANQNPIDEARLFCMKQNIRSDLHEQLIPKIAELIQAEIVKLQSPVILTTVPVAINNQQFNMNHYEGSAPIDTAIQFLKERGLTEATIQQYIPQLVGLIERHLAAIPAQETPVLSMPVIVNQQELELQHYAMNQPEQTARMFLKRHGLETDPQFQQLTQQLTQMIQQQLEQRAASEPLFTLPIKLGDSTHDLKYYDGQDAETTAQAFCTEKNVHFLDKTDTSKTEAEQLQVCTSFLTDTIVSVLKKLQAEAEKLLFTLDIDLGQGQVAKLPFYSGNDPDQVATEFCQQTGIGQDNAANIAQAIRNQIAQLE